MVRFNGIRQVTRKMIARTARRQIPEWRGGADAFHADLGTYLPRLLGDAGVSPILKKSCNVYWPYP
jgi:hypothetical protein